MKNFYLSLVLLVIVGNFSFAQDAFFTEDFGAGEAAGWNAIEVQGNGANGSNWIYTTAGPTGSFATDPIVSTSAENGWYVFDSDLNCSQMNQEAWLVSPRLDASGRSNVFLAFETYYRSFNDRPTVEVSVDSMTWVSFEVFPGVEANSFGGDGENPQSISIDITDVAAGEAQFWVAFRFLSDGSTGNGGNLTGCGYSWQIDDIVLTSADPRPANDMNISSGFFAISPNAVTPASQVTPFGFLADIQNIGSQVQPSADLNVAILDLVTNEEVFTDDLAYGEIGVDSLAENQPFENIYTPEAAVATYTGTYTLTPANGDDNPADNTRSFDFVVSDTTFAKAFLEESNRTIAPAGDNSYAYGNCYYIPSGAGEYARYVSFAVANAEDLIGSSVSILFYKWDGDLNDDFQANPDEYADAPIAFNSYDFDGSESNTLLTLPVSIDEVGILLEDDSYYFVVVQFDAPDEDTNMFLLGSDARDYEAMWFESSLSEDRPTQYASMLDVGNTGDFSYVGFGFDLVPIMRLHISGSSDLTTSTVEVLSEENEIALYPNPTTEVARLDIGLVNAQEVDVQVFSTMGQRVFAQRMGTIQRSSLNLDVSNLAAGTYFVIVRAEEGVRTMKLSVAK